MADTISIPKKMAEEYLDLLKKLQKQGLDTDVVLNIGAVVEDLEVPDRDLGDAMKLTNDINELEDAIKRGK